VPRSLSDGRLSKEVCFLKASTAGEKKKWVTVTKPLSALFLPNTNFLDQEKKGYCCTQETHLFPSRQTEFQVASGSVRVRSKLFYQSFKYVTAGEREENGSRNG
jgi:hypothetical protein